MVKEVGIGAGIGVLIILALKGFNILPVIFFGFLVFFLWQMLSPSLSISSQTGIKEGNKKIPHVKFDDIGGQETAKNELIEALNFVKNLDRIKYMGIRPIKGILLSGPPGTGKTMLAKASARYTDSVFKATSGSEFIEMYAGLGAKRVRQLFKEARQSAKKYGKSSAIVFIDEIDVVGGKRGQVTSHLEYDQTLNQLLVEMDGLSVDDEVQILVMATTNRIDILDPALLRPGRFDRIVQVDLPAKEGRLSILKIHTSNKPLAEEVNLEQIARETFGFSGAHLENLTNEAAIMAMRGNEDQIHQKHFLEAIDKVIMGEKLDRRPGKEELKRIAVHETGHALVGEKFCPGSVSAITITSRGKALGYVRHNPRDDMYLQTRDYIEKQIGISIAGAIAEDILLNDRSTGATNDFKKAVKLANKMVASGMTDLGVVEESTVPKQLLHEERTKIFKKVEKKVRNIINNNKEIMEKITRKLVEEERFSGDELRRLLNN
ncbi:AAA family ATPase [Halothermothrix orenii]|uniref:Microtubule-severing ATPase n=1 Tax=Halothermothrix orenii (strain H 168 / OCM 544 / DSM 9562) TaxID=373903 RepID=B8CXC4_HALOH|nr:AAA family ATPase [Halothermothrix orenii]ACL69943.1 Microtubule-severing ATPase [Halothermothrix orenii H 168]